MAMGILNHATTPTANAAAGTSGSGNTSNSENSSAGSATVSANDFLTLLVTEMQNQDPTADTDPNEYINQLVQVNSLEQLIDINQTLTTALDPATSTSSSGATGQAFLPGTNSLLTGAAATGSSGTSPTAAAQQASTLTLDDFARTNGAQQVSGNLSVPRLNAAAQQVAHALDGRRQTSGILHAAH